MNQETELHNRTSLLAPEFFFDKAYVLSMGTSGSAVDELKAHTILLGSNVESFLKAATLIDGSTVDFLFGVKAANQQHGLARSRANGVKKLIRALNNREQEAVTKFYYAVYVALIGHSEGKAHPCSCVWREGLRRGFTETVDRAFIDLNKELRKGIWENQ